MTTTHLRAALRSVLEDDGRTVEDFASCEAFLAVLAARPGSLPAGRRLLPGMGGLRIVAAARGRWARNAGGDDHRQADVNIAVQAMKAGASDFIEKPIEPQRTARLRRPRAGPRARREQARAWREAAVLRFADLTQRQRR